MTAHTDPGDRHEIFPHVPFPFEGPQFPCELGAVVQRTIVAGQEPVRLVVHDADNTWALGDGFNDPNEPDACLVTCLHGQAVQDPSLGRLVSLPVGYQAWRRHERDAWRIEPHAYVED